MTLEKIAKCNLLVSAGYILASLLFWSFPKTLGVFLGSALMSANFYVMALLVKKALGTGKIRAFPFVLYIFKVLALFGLAFLVLRLETVNKIFFVIGTSVILPSLLIVSLIGWKEEADTEKA